MSKQKKAPVPVTSVRSFKVINQTLTINEINFKKQTISGSTELTILPLTNTGKVWRLSLNCKQSRILRVTVDSQYSAKYAYVDPLLSVCPPDTKKRNLEYYDACHQEKLKSCDTDSGPNTGELIIKIPKDVYSTPGLRDYKPLIVLIDFSLEQPKGGVQFVIPPGTSTESVQHVHVYSYGWENSSRLWFPCVDSYTELCTWSLKFVVPAHMTAVSCGDLTEQLLTADGKRKIFQYSLSVPTSAPCIGFTVGCYEVYPDPVMQEVTHFCLPGFLALLKHTVQFVHEVFGFYEELLSTRFPYSSYKLVFVDHTYQDAASYSTLGLFSVNLLHSPRIIDQVMPTRRLISQAIAKQYFGCYLLPQMWNDWWLPTGISTFLSGLFCRKIFGSTEYQHWVMSEVESVVQYESNHSLPPLCGSVSSTPQQGSSSNSPVTNPNLISDRKMKILTSKAHLVIRMIQRKIGNDLLLQVFNKLLTLASTASQTTEVSLWNSLLISTAGFMKLILTVSGKDMTSFVEQWVCRSGVPRFHSSFTFIRKKNIIELKLRQDTQKGQASFVGPMTVIVQEFDGSFSHTIQVEENTTSHELQCHSKIRKAKKRKVPLSHGEEVDIDISSLDTEVPVLWVRVDPDFHWLRQIFMEQSDTVWQCLLKFERDACSQIDALQALEGFSSTSTRDVYRDTLLNGSYYYRVRIQAAKSLAKYLTETASTGGSPTFLIALYQKLFGSNSHQSIVRYNDFSNVSNYFVQKALPQYIAGIRTVHKQCPKEVIAFIIDLFKYTDNHNNKFSDGDYTSSLIEALSETVTPKVAVAIPAGVDFAKNPVSTLNRETQYVLQEIVQRLNIEKVLPSYKHSITVSCLNCLRVLQKNGHLPNDTTIFREYATSGNYIDVREAALKAIVDVIQADHVEGDLNFILGLMENDEPRVQLIVMRLLSSNPPFARRTDSRLDTLPLVERLWSLLCSKFHYDVRLRNSTVDVFSSLYGRLTPTCVPQGLGMVIDLKERVARSSLTTPVMSPKAALTADESSQLRVPPSAGIRAASSGPTSPASTQSPTAPLLRVIPAEHPQVVAIRSGQQQSQPLPPLSLKISTAQLKRMSPSLSLPDDVMDNRSVTASPESALSPGTVGSDDSASLSPYPPKAKRHKGEHKQKHKHKKKKSKKSKHKHKHASKDFVDVESID